MTRRHASKKRRRFWAGFLALFLWALPSLFPAPGPGAAESFKDTLAAAAAKFEQIQDYQCRYESFATNGKESETFLYKLSFSKPKNIRLEILKGRSKGTILLYDPVKKRVRFRVGSGLLSSLVLNMSPANRKLVDVNGHGIDHADWGWLLGRHLEQADLFAASCLGEEPVGGRLSRVYELVSSDPARTSSIAREKIWFDAELDVITQFQLFDRNNNLFQSSTFTDIVLNPGLNKDLFKKF
jgi:outer membrane lipoprotein-sorting protein